MPKRVVDGEGVWRSKKLRKVSEGCRAEYANLLPLAEANGVFELDIERIWSDVYSYNRPNVSLEMVERIFTEFEENDLLRVWEEKGKIWVYWTGIGKTGRLPKPSELVKYKSLPPFPPESISGDSAETQRILAARFGVGFGSGIGIGNGLEPAALDNSEIPLIGQEDDVNLKNFKAEMAAAGVKYGFKVTGYQQTWEDLIVLTKAHSSQAVINDFSAFCLENKGSEFNNVLTKYLYVAADRLIGEAPALAEVKSPALTNLNRELTYLSGGVISFIDKQKIKLAELLQDWSEEEVVTVFKEWLADQDLTDAKNLQYLPSKFVQTADSRCYSLRRSREEKAAEAAARQKAVERLQEAANAEREEAAKKRQEEEEQFDPLKELGITYS